MSLYENKFMEYYNYIFTDLADPRTNNWPLISSPVPGLTILGAYLYFVLSWGPRYMRDRKPYKLEKVLIVYNIIQVIVSTYIFYEGAFHGWFAHYNWRCQPVNTSTGPDGIREARGVYLYFLAKISELLDTVFFVLRKKERQISFLHMYHHTVMPMISWGATKYYPGGHGTFIGTINSFVHIVMYAYYLLAACGPQVQKYLWWKKYITNMQMIQFCMAFLHSSQLLWSECGYPRWSVCFTLPNAIFFYHLFNQFYKKSYVSEDGAKAGDKSKQQKALNDNNNNDSNNNETSKEKDLNKKQS